jgi:hypothetical protein
MLRKERKTRKTEISRNRKTKIENIERKQQIERPNSQTI